MKASVYIAASLDGFIARPTGALDWLEQPPADGEDYGYAEFMSTVDVLVMGRHTFDKVMSFGQWPYGEKSVIVLTTRPVHIPEPLRESVDTLSGAPAEVVTQLARRGARHLYVDGGKTIQTFLDGGLIQRLIITRLPILLGSGIPLFGPLRHDITLRHVGTRIFADGKVQSEYEVS